MATKTVRMLRNGQFTIPVDVRRQLGIDDQSLLQVRVEEGELRIRPVRVVEEGSPWVRDLYNYFAPVRQEAIDRGYTEQQINDAIDEAIAESRRERAAR